MKFNRFFLIPVILLILSGAITLLFIPQLPETIATRWSPEGEVISEGPKFTLFLTAVLPLLALWLIYKSPSVNPAQKDAVKHKHAYIITIGFFLLFLIGIHWLIVFFNIGIILRTAVIAKILIGLALMLTGWFLPKIEFNNSVGIRTPWSTSDEIIWEKTHKAGGRLFFTAGVIFFISSFFEGRAAFWIGAVTLIGIVILLYLYSYMLDKKHKES